MKIFKYATPGIIVAAGLFLNTATSLAKPEYSKKEKKPCVTCHVKAGSKDLNATGKYYSEHKALPEKK
jgi:hypothetical protein